MAVLTIHTKRTGRRPARTLPRQRHRADVYLLFSDWRYWAATAALALVIAALVVVLVVPGVLA